MSSNKLDIYYNIEEVLHLEFLKEKFESSFQQSPTTPQLSNLPPYTIGGLDPSSIINPSRKGAVSYRSSPLANKLAGVGNINGKLNLNNLKILTKIGPGADTTYYSDGEFRLHPKAAEQWFKWKKDMDDKNIYYRVSSAYRNQTHQATLDPKNAASPGSSPHGWGGALDFSNLYRLVGGSTSPILNTNARKLHPIYKQIAEIGVKYGWYNPYRLSDGSGKDEIWHFEYWGEV